MTESFPDKPMFQALKSRVDTVEGNQAVPLPPRLRDGVPDVELVIAPSGQQAVTSIKIGEPTGDWRLVDEIRIQVPPQSSAPAGMTAALRLDSSEATEVQHVAVIEDGGKTWLSVRLLAPMEPYGRIALNFAQPYAVLVGDISENLSNMATNTTVSDGTELMGLAIGVQLHSAGTRNVIGKISPDALPTTPVPTGLPTGAAELVLAQPPYWRVIVGGQEYRSEFVAVPPAGGEAT